MKHYKEKTEAEKQDELQKLMFENKPAARAHKKKKYYELKNKKK